MLKTTILVSCALLLTACATVPLAPELPDRLATTAPSPEIATIFVARPGVLGTAVLHQVTLDGVVVGQLAIKTYLRLDVAPGVHTLAIPWGMHIERVQVTLAPGEQAFYRLAPWSGALTRVTPQDGQQAIAKSRLAQRLDQ